MYLLVEKVHFRGFSRLLVLVSLCVVLSSAVQSQVRFIQIADPHIFDDQNKLFDNRQNNLAALTSSIDKINAHIAAEQSSYQFVVITGDLGVGKLANNLTDAKEIDSRIKGGARDLAAVLARSAVRTWLFIPGSSDVLDQKPENTSYYHHFVQALSRTIDETINDFKIIDLCPASENEGGNQSKSGSIKFGKFTFIGFDDSTFRNAPDEESEAQPGGGDRNRIEANFELQKSYSEQVRAHLDDADVSYAYVFFHLPAIDDPSLVARKPDDALLQRRYGLKDEIGGSYFHSVWFVKSQVRIAWNTVVINPKVRGLFAGGFYDH